MEVKYLNQCFNNLVISEISGDYSNILIELSKLSELKFSIKPYELDLIDSCLKNSISKLRKNLNHIIFTKETLNIIKTKQSSCLVELEESKLRDLNQSTQNIIKHTAKRDDRCSFYLPDSLPLFNQRRLLMKTEEDYKKLLTKLYSQVILICVNFQTKLINKDQEDVKLFFIKTIADHKRYTYELTGADNDKIEAEAFYKEAKKAASQLRAVDKYNLLYLKFYINYTVFLYDILEDGSRAVEETKQVLETTLLDYNEIKTNEQKDLILIWQIMKENLALWMQTKPGEYDNWLKSDETYYSDELLKSHSNKI